MKTLPSMPLLELLLSKERIAAKIKETAEQLVKDYGQQEITLVMVMKGAICLAADLIRHLPSSTSLEFVQANSYGARGTKKGELFLKGIDALDLSSKHVLLIDDIFDTGDTLQEITKQLRQKNPKMLKTLVLLAKKVCRKTQELPDYVLFEIEDRYVVGYGLDYKERYRGLPGIYCFGP